MPGSSALDFTLVRKLQRRNIPTKKKPTVKSSLWIETTVCLFHRRWRTRPARKSYHKAIIVFIFDRPLALALRPTASWEAVATVARRPADKEIWVRAQRH